MKTILHIVRYFMVIALFSACNNSNLVSIEADFGEIEELIWQNPDSANSIIKSFSAQSLSKANKMRLTLLQELIKTRTNNMASPDSTIQAVIDYYKTTSPDETLLAKAYYIQGVELFTQLHYFEALLSLKEAEGRIEHLPNNLPYACLIYFTEGQIAETEYLFHIACDCYEKALEHAIHLHDDYRTACCYYNIARTKSEYNDSTSLQYYANALNIVEQLHDTIFYYDILIQKELHNKVMDSACVYQYSRYLTDSFNIPLFSHFVVEYLQNRQEKKAAETYLSICAQDTLWSGWSRDNFYYLQSRQNALKGNTRLAFEQLDRLYQNQTEQIFKNGKTKTYTISRMYDLEQEKNKTLQLSIEKQRLWITIAIIIFIFIIAVTSATYIIHLQKQRHKAQQQANEIERLKAQAAEEAANKEIDRLNLELEMKRIQLRDSLKERIQLSKDIAQATEETTKDFPKWLQAWIQKNTFIQGENIDRLLIEFKSVYGNLLTQLKKKHPGLTDKDLQYIALSILGLDVNDVCHILGTTERTIWNRRQSVKNRLGNPKMDYEEWILQLRKVPNF